MTLTRRATWIELAGWSLALFCYFGPWVGHPAAALAWNAYDLFDFLRLLPEIESNLISVNLQALRLPLVGLGVLLPMILAETKVSWRIGAALVGAILALATLPAYPQIIGAWGAPGWRIPFWWGVGGITAALGSVWLGPKLLGYRPWLCLAWIALTTIPSAVTFQRLLPALTNLHAAVIRPGWGFWGCLTGFSVLALMFWIQGFWPRKEIPMTKHTDKLAHVRAVKAAYEGQLMRKANVVGVGIGFRMRDSESSGELALIVNVTHKVPLEQLAPKDRIPDHLDDVPIQVNAIGEVKAQ